ncbi:MAG: ABC transporter ATP-binding protein [Nitrospirae bacterium]|nr:ABC transporter ATP-binding protein [Nitrospirota bacterium]
MSECVLKVSGLGKAFRKYRSEWQRIFSWFGISVTPAAEHWVLRGVSFSVASGEAVGIVGQNGAGKSTLLKLITGTLRATEGEVQIHGRIAAILELGMGFNPEFTGRQNVYHAAGLMGFSRKAIEHALPEIEAFAEIGGYFDQPMRTYSSGMQMRVAFAAVTAFRPEILIVDEALSVGDSYFQHKSFDRIRQFKEQGTSLLFVTHSMGDVQTLCDRVILLDKGQALRDGLPDEVVDYYNALIAEKENAKLTVEQLRQKNGWILTKSGTGEATLADFRLTDADSNQEVHLVRVGQRVILTAIVKIHADIPRLVLGYMLRDRMGHVVWGTNTWHTKQIVEDLRAGQVVEFKLLFTCTLGPGSYSFSPALVSTDTHLVNNYEWKDNALVFDVLNAGNPYFIGTSWLDAVFDINRRGMV